MNWYTENLQSDEEQLDYDDYDVDYSPSMQYYHIGHPDPDIINPNKPYHYILWYYWNKNLQVSQIFEKEDRVVIEYMDYDETGSDSWRKEFFWNGNEWSEYNPKDKI